MCNVIAIKTKKKLASAMFIFVFTNEMTFVDNQSWLSYYGYVAQQLKRFFSLMHLVKIIVDDCDADNLKTIILDAMLHQPRLEYEGIRGLFM